jgi:hypothetical protein
MSRASVSGERARGDALMPSSPNWAAARPSLETESDMEIRADLNTSEAKPYAPRFEEGVSGNLPRR